VDWYYRDGDQEFGPLSRAQLQALIHDKKVTAQTPVRTSQTHEWRPLVEYVSKKPTTSQPQGMPPGAGQTPTRPPPIAPPPPPVTKPSKPVATAVCSQCGRSFPEDQVVRFEGKPICGACKPMFVQRLKEGLSLDPALRYAGFWIRFGAKIIDGLITTIVSWVLTIPLALVTASAEGGISFGLMAVQQLIGILIPVMYNTWFVGRFAATPGKMACGLRVVSAEGGQIGYGRALGRTFAEWLSAMILLVGYIMAAFDSEKRALHDRICSTRVVRK